MLQLKSISFMFVLLLIGALFLPIVSAQANESKNSELMEEIKYTTDHSRILYESSNEKIVASELMNGEIVYNFYKTDEVNPNRVYFSGFSQNELITLSQTILPAMEQKSHYSKGSFNTEINQMLNIDVSSDNYKLTDETATVLFAAAASYVGFGRGSYAESYGNTITGGVAIHLSEIDARQIVGGSGATLTALGGGLLLASALNFGVSAVPGSLLTVIGSVISTYYLIAQNSDGTLDMRYSYLLLSFYILGIPGVGLHILIGTYKYYI